MKQSKNSKASEILRKKLKQEYLDRGIIECEVNLQGCYRNNFLSFAHKDKRIKYLKRPNDLWTFKETIIACIPCHQIIEYDRELTLSLFKKLRNN